MSSSIRSLPVSRRRSRGRSAGDDEENILQALDSGVELESVYYAGDEIVSNELRNKLTPSVKIFEVAKRTTKKIFENDKITCIFAIAKTPKPIGLDAITKIQRDMVVLEDVSISGNIGAITRTSLAHGVGGMVLLNTEHVDVLTTSASSVPVVAMCFVCRSVATTTEAFIHFAKQNNLQVLVTNAHAEKLVQDIASLPQRLMNVFGSEKDGCSPAITAAATLQVRIPIDPRVESLNGVGGPAWRVQGAGAKIMDLARAARRSGFAGGRQGLPWLARSPRYR